MVAKFLYYCLILVPQSIDLSPARISSPSPTGIVLTLFPLGKVCFALLFMLTFERDHLICVSFPSDSLQIPVASYFAATCTISFSPYWMLVCCVCLQLLHCPFSCCWAQWKLHPEPHSQKYCLFGGIIVQSSQHIKFALMIGWIPILDKLTPCLLWLCF